MSGIKRKIGCSNSTDHAKNRSPLGCFNCTNHFPLLLLVFLVAPKILAADTGLYDISDSSHPKPFQDQVGEVTISSQSNDNKHYYLAVRALHSFSRPCEQIGLVVQSKIIRFDSQGEDGQGHFTSMETTVDDPEIIPEIANFFHVPIINRHHPGQKMLVKFVPDKSDFETGEPVLVKLRLTNVGDKDFAFMKGGRQRGRRNNQFAFTAEIDGKMLADTGDPKNAGGLASPITLKPGESEEIAVDLGKWFKFERGENYNLRGSYYMEFVDPKTDDLYTIWEDYACAEFQIKIKR